MNFHGYVTLTPSPNSQRPPPLLLSLYTVKYVPGDMKHVEKKHFNKLEAFSLKQYWFAGKRVGLG